jgi:hypothetical protein
MLRNGTEKSHMFRRKGTEHTLQGFYDNEDITDTADMIEVAPIYITYYDMDMPAFACSEWRHSCRDREVTSSRSSRSKREDNAALTEDRDVIKDGIAAMIEMPQLS